MKKKTHKIFTFKNGLSVRLRRLGRIMITRLIVDRASEKYPVPEVVRVFGTRKQEKLVYDYDNANWLSLVNEQMQKDRGETVGNLSVFSVIDNPNEEQYEFYKQIAVATRSEDVDDNFIKSLWILDQIEDEEELEDFQNAIMGITTVTERGLQESQKKFQPESEQ